MRKRIAVLLSVCLILSLNPTISLADTTDLKGGQSSQANFTDVSGHWASEAILKWADLGVVKGDNKAFRPDDPITRAEMAVILDNLMGYQKKADFLFTDVEHGAWYADAVLKANAAGVFSGDGAGHAIPTANITREQAAVMLARAFGVENGSADKSSFKDIPELSAWAQPLVFGMEANQYIGGMSNGNFEPKANVTRAQVVTMIDNAVKGYYTVSGTYTDDVAPTVKGANCIAVIKADGVTLKGGTVSGDLIIAEGVGDGTLTLDGTKITGKLIARGGGKNSIHIINGAQVNGRITIERVDGAVRIVSDGVTIANLDADSEVILEGNFSNVVVEEDAAVEVRGQVENISVAAKSAITISQGAKVGTVSVDKEAEGTKISVSGTVSTITTDAPKTEIAMKGTAKIAKVNASENATGSNVSMDKDAELKTLNSDSAITASGDGTPKAVTGNGKVTNKKDAAESSGGGGGGGGGGTTGGSETPDKTSPVVNAGTANRISKTEGTVKFISNEAGQYYYAVVDHNAKAPTVYTTGGSCTTAEITLRLTLNTGAKDIYVKVKDVSGNVSNPLKITIPEYKAAYQYALVKAYVDIWDNGEVELLKADGTTKVFCYSDHLIYQAEKGQVIAYTVNEDGEIDAIASDSSNKLVYADAGLTIEPKNVLKFDNVSYTISENAVIFTYDGITPGAIQCHYDTADVDSISNGTVISPVSIYLDRENNVAALLIPKSALSVWKPGELKGIAPTSAANHDGKITGVDSTMEYKRSTSSDYIAITGNEVAGLGSGTYYVRYAETKNHIAGPYVTVEVPEYVAADQYAIVVAYDKHFGVKLCTVNDTTKVYQIADDIDAEAVRGQLLAYGINKDGEIGAMDPTNAAISVSSGVTIISADELKINSSIYEISADVAVFTYSGTDPGDSNSEYDIGSINHVVYNVSIDYPVSIYFVDRKVKAILIPKSGLRSIH